MLLSDEHVSRAFIIIIGFFVAMRNSQKERTFDPGPGILGKNQWPEPTANGRIGVVGEDGTTTSAQFGPKAKLQRKLPGRSRRLARSLTLQTHQRISGSFMNSIKGAVASIVCISGRLQRA